MRRGKKLHVRTQISMNKLRNEISEKKTETLKTNRKLSKTQKDLENLRTEFVKSKDAKSQLAQENAELYDRIAKINATQKRLDVETQISMDKLRNEISEKKTETLKTNRKLTATETKLGTTEAALTAKQRALEDAQAKLERRETDTPCIICLDSDKNSAMVPCGHTSTCYNCSLTLHSRDDAKCPVCRQLIHRIVRIYL